MICSIAPSLLGTFRTLVVVVFILHYTFCLIWDCVLCTICCFWMERVKNLSEIPGLLIRQLQLNKAQMLIIDHYDTHLWLHKAWIGCPLKDEKYVKRTSIPYYTWITRRSGLNSNKTIVIHYHWTNILFF